MGKLALFNLRVVLTGVLGASLALLAAAPAHAAYPHPDVVIKNPDDNTAQLVATDSVPHPRANELTATNGSVFLGGLFGRIKDNSGTYDRHNVAAVDEASGQVLPFTVDVGGRIFALAAQGDSVYIGGKFKLVNGINRANVVKVDAQTGEVDKKFRPGIRGRVNDLEVSRGMLIVAGAFGKRLVAMDLDTGKHSDFLALNVSGKLPNSAGNTSITSVDVDPDGNHLVAIGNFTTVAGQDRTRAFMADLGPGSSTLSPWYYSPLAKRCLSNTRTKQAYLSDVDFSPDGSYFVLVSTGYVPYRTSEIGETICDAAARFETEILDPFRPTWIQYTGGDTIWSTAVTGAAVYIQGHFRWMDNPEGKDSMGPGAVVRRGIGAIDPKTGMALPWNPPKPARRGGRAFLATETGLWIGSDSLRMKGEPHRGLAYVPLP